MEKLLWVKEVRKATCWGHDPIRGYVSDGEKGHIEKHTLVLESGASIYIIHRGALREISTYWDVGVKLPSGKSYDRIFSGQPIHKSVAAAQEWVRRNLKKIIKALAKG
jgi:hypothetical protein